MQRRTILSTTGLLAAVLLLPFTAGSAGASTPDPEPPQPGPTLEVGDTDPAAIADALVYAPVTAEQNDWFAKVAAQFEKSDNYTSTEISLDRTEITVTWFGPVDPELERLIETPPANTVVTAQAEHPRLLVPDSGPTEAE